jgi:hypothetical protein
MAGLARQAESIRSGLGYQDDRQVYAATPTEALGVSGSQRRNTPLVYLTLRLFAGIQDGRLGA